MEHLRSHLKLRSSEQVRLVVTAAIGVIVSLLVFVTLRASDRRIERIEFERRAEQRFALVQLALAQPVRLVKGTEAFFAASSDVSADEFSRFWSHALVEYPIIHSVERIDRVPAESRARFERGEPGGAVSRRLIYERDRDGHVVAAPIRDEYFPVRYVAPPEFGDLIGMDRGANPSVRALLEHAIDTGEVTVSDTMSLHEAHEIGNLFVMAIYRNGIRPTSAEERRAAMVGLIVLAAEPQEAIERLIASGGPSQLDTRVREANSNNPLPVFMHLPRSGADIGTSASFGQTNRPELRYERTVRVGDRDWIVEIAPAPGFGGGQRPSLAPALFALGLFATVALVWLRRRDFQTKALLQVSRDNLAAAQSISRVGSWIIDIPGNQLFLTDETYRIFGMARDKALAVETFTAQIHHDDRDRVLQAWRAAREGADFDVEYRLPLGNEVRWVHVRADLERDGTGTAVRAQGTVQDVTERKLAELNMQEARRLLEAVIESVPARIFWKDRQMNYLGCNTLFALDAGKSAPADVIGRSDFEMGWATQAEAYRNDDEAVMASGRAKLAYVEPQATPDGHTIWLRTSKVPLRDSRGNVVGVLGIYDDVSAERAASQRLQDYNEELERRVADRTAELVAARDAAQAASRSKSEFLANMSHEIRTPLNGILGMTHLLRQDIADPLHAKRLGKVYASAQSLLGILNDILDLSKIESGKMTLEAVDFTPATVVAATVDLVRDRAAAKQIDLQVDLAQLPQRLHGDGMRLGQILLNFISNAVKFTDHGRVTVAGSVAGRKDGQVSVRFDVTDTGIGLSDEQRARIFDAFEQADGSTTRRYGGSGLGLTINQRLVDLMGGTLGVSSTPGQGSNFWVEIPFAEATTSENAIAPLSVDEAMALLAGRAAHVLLVEDNEFNQAVAEGMLCQAGLAVTVANNGREALERLQAGTFDLVLMDMQMPVMDGIEATRAIRRMPGLQDLPIVAMTANAFDEDRRKCLAAGMNDHLGKPVDPLMLYLQLLKWLPANKPAVGDPAAHA